MFLTPFKAINLKFSVNKFHKQNYELYLWFKKKCGLTALCSPRELCLYLGSCNAMQCTSGDTLNPIYREEGREVCVGGMLSFPVCPVCLVFTNACAHVCAKSLNQLKLCFILTHPEILSTVEVKDPTFPSTCL